MCDIVMFQSVMCPLNLPNFPPFALPVPGKTLLKTRTPNGFVPHKHSDNPLSQAAGVLLKLEPRKTEDFQSYTQVAVVVKQSHRMGNIRNVDFSLQAQNI